MKIFEMFGEVFIKDEASKSLDDVDGKLKKFGGSMKAFGTKVAVGAAVVGGAFIGFGLKALGAAANAEEMQNKFDVVFSGMTEKAEAWSESFAEAVGRSNVETKTFLSNISDLLIGMGSTQDEAFDLSTKIVTLATDLASFNNVNDFSIINSKREFYHEQSQK